MANAPAASQALTVLQLLARHTEPVPASAIARDLGLPRSSVYHLLTVLCDHLVDATRHNAHLAVLHGRDVLYVIEERAPGRPPLVTDVGVRR
jgi:DNA-binding IclR family transcriptional regulator